MRCISLIKSFIGINFTILSILVMFLIGVQVCFATDEIPQEVQDWQVAAAAYEESGDFAAAHAEYQKIIQAYPNTPYGLDACVKRANLYTNQKQFENILPLVEQICTNFSDQPGMFKACRTLVEKCMYAKAYPVAESVCTQVQSRFSSSPRVVLMVGWRGMVYAHQGDFTNAEQMRQTLVQTEDCTVSDFLGAMGNIGWGYYCAGNHEEALATYRMALLRDSADLQSVYLQYQIIKTYLAQGSSQSADQEMQTLLTRYADFDITPGLAYRLANEYYKKGFYLEAIGVYELLQARFENHELIPVIIGMEIKTYEMLAERYLRENNQMNAIAAYETVIEKFPSHQHLPAIYDAIVKTYADMGDLVKAQQALLIDIENCPHRRELLRMITRVAVETARAGDTEKAMDLVQEIFNQNPEGTDQLFGYTTLARVYVHQGGHNQVMTTLQNALAQFENQPGELSYHLFGIGEEYYFKALANMNNPAKEIEVQIDFDRAVSAWQSILSALPASTQNKDKILYYTGMAYWYRKSYADALDSFLRVTAEFPDYKHIPQVMNLSAKCYLKLRDQEYITPAETEEGLEMILDHAVSINSTSSLSEIVWNLGQLNYESEQWGDAIKYLKLCQEYIVINPTKAVELDHQLAQAYENSGDNHNAVKYYLSYLDKLRTDDIQLKIALQKKIQRLQRKIASN